MAQLRLFDEGGLVCGVQVKVDMLLRLSVVSVLFWMRMWSRPGDRSFIKLVDGDVRVAVRLLCSAEQGVMPDQHSLRIMTSKHPIRPLDRRALPKSRAPPLSATVQEVMLANKSFPVGSSGGVDGLRPQHPLDMLEGAAPSVLVDTILEFVNLLLAGGVPEAVQLGFFGGRLFALSKPGGYYRQCLSPIGFELTTSGSVV